MKGGGRLRGAGEIYEHFGWDLPGNHVSCPLNFGGIMTEGQRYRETRCQCIQVGGVHGEDGMRERGRAREKESGQKGEDDK